MRARVTLSTGSLFGYPLDRILAIAAALGLDGVEVLLTDALLAAGPDMLAARAARHGIPVLSVHFPFIGRRTEAEFHAAYEQTAAFAAALPACEAVVVHTTLATSLHGAQGIAYLQALRHAQQRLRGTRARVSIENRGVSVVPARPAYLDDLLNLRRLAEEWDFGLTYDIGHAASWGLDIGRALDALGPRVGTIHLSNSRARGWPLALPGLHSHLRDHQPLDSGLLPINDLLGKLALRRFAGLVTLELSPLALHWPRPWRARDRLADSVARCRAGLAAGRRAPGARGVPGAPGISGGRGAEDVQER
jgi:sugar phosphate isomerase/epimerase